MFVFQFNDGKYLKNLGKSTCLSKRHYDYFVASGWEKSWLDQQLQYLEEAKTDNINEAQVFTSVASIRCSNCYSWGGSIHEVETVIRKKAT